MTIELPKSELTNTHRNKLKEMDVLTKEKKEEIKRRALEERKEMDRKRKTI